MPDFKPLIGIDLGTTFSAVAYVNEHDKPEVIPNQEGNLTTPSVVHFYDKGSFIVGDEAVNMRLSEPKNTVSFIKRMMGDTDYKVDIYGKEYNPQEISAFILKKLKKDAESYFVSKGYDGEVRDAVISVPAYFSMDQRGATKEAGELAGLNVLHIINEPTAAALAFGINQLGNDKTVFVFDLGGGTFDVTILEIRGNEINMIASHGDPELGGKDWDDTLLDHCTKLFKAKHGTDPQDDIFSYQELYDRVLKAKISLSQRPKTKIQVSHEGARENIDMPRETFEEISEDLLTQCQSMSYDVLEKAKKTWNDIDIILLVGGSTYMPMIKDMIKKISGKEPTTDVNPDLCVAIGAALQAKYRYIDDVIEKVEKEKGKEAARKEKKKLLRGLPDIKVKECVAKSIGIIVVGEDGKTLVVDEMIPEQTTIPFTVEREFGYAEDNQTSVCVKVTEGRGKTPDEVDIIGKTQLNDLPPRPKHTPIKVSYTFNRDKTLDVEVTDVETKKTRQEKVVLEGSMTEEYKKVSRENIASMEQH
jgi:molecular chaperone DnaK